MLIPNTERLGLRGMLTLIESAIRLAGGANATGALAAGAAYHTFAANQAGQFLIREAAVAFLAGVTLFTIAYVFWIVASLELDNAIPTEEGSIKNEIFKPARSLEQHLKRGKIGIVVVVIAGLGSLFAFLFGLNNAVRLGLQL